MHTLISSGRRMLALAGPSRRATWLVLPLIALLVTAFEALGAALLFALVGLATAPDGGVRLPFVGDVTSRFGEHSPKTMQLAVAVAVGFFFLVRACVVVGQQYVQSRMVHQAGARVASRLVRGYLSLPYLFHTQRNSAELVRNAFDTAQRLVNQVMIPLATIVSETVLVIGLGGVLLAVSPMATGLAVIALGPTILLLQRILQPRLRSLGRDSQLTRGTSLQALQQALGGFRDIRLLGREESFSRAFSRQRDAMARSEYMRTSLAGLPRALIETSVVLVIVALFVTALVSGRDVRALGPTIGVFAYVGLRLQPSLQKIVAGVNELRFGTAALDDLTADYNRIEAERAESTGADGDLVPFRTALELRGLSFSYAEDGVRALQHVDLRIERGEFIGICGPTGGGKSTLIDIIVGLLQPSEGEVLIDGVPLRGRERQWQRQLGVVSQAIFLTDDTIRRNIAFGCEDDEIDEEALASAVDRSQLGPVIADLPLGLDTAVGERGVRLSGGQRQRVAIARALYRTPNVIVFDEGTSALDSVTEAALVRALDELKDGERTLISVAHRMSTVRGADRIIVMQDGEIAAQGAYEHLVTDSALFRSLAG